jgi:hypothetical protein
MDDSQQDDASGLHAHERGNDAAQNRGASGAGRGGDDPLFVGIGAICETATRLTGADGAAVAVLAAHGVRELVYASDALAQQLDELQFIVGEGPCLDAYHQVRPQLCAEVDNAFAARWPAFAAELAELGVAAVFAFPVPGQHRPMGVLELYRRTSGELSDAEQRSAQVCASALRTTLEINWRKQLAHSTSEDAAIEAAALRNADATRSDPFTRSQVYVAAGMVAVQLSIPTREALDRLRGYAYAHKMSIMAVAADVVARRLSFRHLDDPLDDHFDDHFDGDETNVDS